MTSFKRLSIWLRENIVIIIYLKYVSVSDWLKSHGLFFKPASVELNLLDLRDSWKMTSIVQERDGNQEALGEAKTMDCVDNLLIGKMVLHDEQFQKRNSSCSWVDVKKAFSVSHQWIIRTLETDAWDT